ncbi:MAG: 16S rRNA (cytosine(1402)-N(4))-methyltransferase RsmH [Bacteroidales bacterium]|nr:16S rRNA (cytosine(1402)-N(4))-methyltransferase RsmH [Bacteroidales bacterium]MBD5205262.1 16S rRNA (cytosine(1402)-N(4))-methyltransferase RsmH [Bacteroidales bacterium]MBD5301953.1 16S rRNA (cytosine(1402)-N(4))-methyltransferase RsmH [Bacteroides sp.]
MEQSVYHIPALLEDSIKGLDIKPGGTYADVTFGGGGHSRAILEHLGPEGILFGFDRDTDALANAPLDRRFKFVHSDFRYISNFLHFYGHDCIDGIIADLGVSFHHFDASDRGFSFRSDAPLDMRMNRNGGKTAAEILNSYNKEELEQLFRAFTDLKRPGLIASAIVKSREAQPLETTFQLVDAVRPTINPRAEKKDLAQVFQAIRIEVNGEMKALQCLLQQSLRVLKPGGRIAIITYHSIEDRLVKNFLRSGNIEGKIEQDIFGNINSPWKTITRSPIVPSEAEIEANPRSRSAKLRIAEKI